MTSVADATGGAKLTVDEVKSRTYELMNFRLSGFEMFSIRDLFPD